MQNRRNGQRPPAIFQTYEAIRLTMVGESLPGVVEGMLWAM